MPNEDLLKEIQDNSYKLLDSFDKFCKKHSINYFIGYGTLIGAIRHKGFIPWDDDIDILLMREDFDKLVAIPDEEYPDGFFMERLGHDGYFFNFIPRFCTDSMEYFNPDKGEMYSLGLDLFVIDKAKDSRISQWMLVKRLTLLYALARGQRKHYKPVEDRSKVADLLIRPIQCVGKRKSLSSMFRKYDELSKTGNSETMVFVSNAGIGNEGIYPVYYANDYDGTIMVKFEEGEFPAPVGYDRILRQTYGDYMIPDRRVPKHIEWE